MGMKTYIQRLIEGEIRKRLKQFPVVAILGPRQCGKSTLAKRIVGEFESVYLDLEVPSHLNRLTDAETFLRLNNDKLICIDEIQRKPDIFPVIRGICDIAGRPGQMLLLGSASPDLLKQTSESLAGRIAYIDLTPFLLDEVGSSEYRLHWMRGGFPDSYLSVDNDASLAWRENFVKTYLEQDIPTLGFNVSNRTIRNLWTMLAHTSGQVINYSKLSQSLGISPPTVKSYIDILEKTYMVRILQPFFINLKKRVVKSPKVYLRDTGILHYLLGVDTMNDLLGHPAYGNSWESYALEQVCSKYRGWKPFFFRTQKGAEIDLILEKGNRKIAIEFKASASPKPARGFYNALEDLDICQAFIVAPLPTNESYSIQKNITVTTLAKLELS